MRLHDCMNIYGEPSQVDVEVTHNPSRVLQVTAFSSEVDVKKKEKKTWTLTRLKHDVDYLLKYIS